MSKPLPPLPSRRFSDDDDDDSDNNNQPSSSSYRQVYEDESDGSSVGENDLPPPFDATEMDTPSGSNSTRSVSRTPSYFGDTPGNDDDNASDAKDDSTSIREKKALAAWQGFSDGLDAQADINANGGIDVKLNIKKRLPPLPPDYALSVEEPHLDPSPNAHVPSLNVLIQIVGSRGDVQPYLSLAIELVLCDARHRVRIATHDEFKEFVIDTGRRILKGRAKARGMEGAEELAKRLEFFPIGGSPKELMAYMVKNPGLIPGIESIRAGDIKSKQRMLKQMMHNFFLACFYPDPDSGRPFAPDALLCNPPSFAHLHLAESFGLPLCMSFTMPWSPTTAFSHPLVNVQQSNAEPTLTNYFSYGLAEILTWQGLGTLTNKYRKKLRLRRLGAHEGPGLADRLKVPHMYCWSPELAPKPADWKEHISVVGFFFLEDQTYDPEPALKAFLEAGPPPIYIGFGSIVVDDPDALTKTIFEAIERAGVRALVSAGWSKIGGADIPSNVHLLGPIPHDWLFAQGRVSAVVHHGGAGTTACGLRNGRPTVVVPFFGDQPWQGRMVNSAGAGPPPIPHKSLTAENLAEAIQVALSDECRAGAAKLGDQIRAEHGELAGVRSFHAHLPLRNMRCDLEPERVAYWWNAKLALRLSGFAAETLIKVGKIKRKTLSPHRPREYDPFRPVPYPLAGGVVSVLKATMDATVGGFQLFYKPHIGIYKMATAAPFAFLGMLDSVHDLLHSVPSWYGSPMPETRVTGIGSGFAEAGKQFWYGFRDGYGGLVTAPMARHKEMGWAGVPLGITQGILDMMFKPVAGTMSLISQPFKGFAVAAASRSWKDHPLARPRAELGSEVTTGDERRVLDAFEEALKTTKERRKRLESEAKNEMQEMKKEMEEAGQVGGDAT